ncbi:hypothetical protein COS50_04620 [Candidatus Roizmanbacteria bacterium CG03_land_8_20_14_0_80_35_26]|uniref:Uncharacterized protein n=1 Tax=Candidatus Roizmanbacteria bacterium CG03_land_8_20_14_0_80_35_26 TaxID=1974845 RepID=A0A2M7BVM4_9BACT|nr:MAG: hypothetical protein COS50_04620 [Candidatus Roizmanbacteria bacterium CG03_land_8_20_14_0_80_35_26]
MEHKINHYIKSHMMTMMIVVLTGFLVLFLGEFMLYRKIMYINKIVSEGFMQMKEATKPGLVPSIVIKK